MVSEYTWPNYDGNDKAGCKVIIDEQGYSRDIQYGKTKVFIKSPQTVFGLEESRSKLIPGIVIFLQKVRIIGDILFGCTNQMWKVANRKKHKLTNWYGSLKESPKEILTKT